MQRGLTPACGVAERRPGPRAHAHGHHRAPQQQPLHPHPGEGGQKQEVHGSRDGHARRLRVGDPAEASVGAAPPRSPAPAWLCQPNEVQLVRSPRGTLALPSLGLSPLGKWSQAKTWEGAHKRLKVLSQAPLSSQAHLLAAHLVGLCPFAGHEEALGGGQGEGEVLVDCGSLRLGDPGQAAELVHKDGTASPCLPGSPQTGQRSREGSFAGAQQP